MLSRRIINLTTCMLLSAFHSSPLLARQVQSDATKTETTAKAENDTNRTQAEGRAADRSEAEGTAERLRKAVPVVPALARSADALLNTNGQRATQNQLVTSSNVKDPASDAFPLTGALPLEATEPVRIPTEQFTAALPKFYAAVPVLDPISTADWRFKFGSPLFSLRHGPDGMRGFRSAAPGFSATGPLAGGKVLVFESLEYRLSKTSIQNLFRERHDTRYQSFDLNTHFDIKASRRHSVTSRLVLFSQDQDFAGLGGSIAVEATPHYRMRGGQLFLSDAYTDAGGFILSSSIGVRKLRLRVLPQGDKPLQFIEQGETLGNYFDTLRRNSNRVEWRETLRLPAKERWGRHRISLGGALNRSGFDSSRLGGTIILRGHDEDEITSITTFAGSPFEALSVWEMTGWGEDRWSPSPRASFTLGMRYDRTTLARRNQWAPRLGFSILPFDSSRTVIRGGLGVFYDIIPLTAGTFTGSRQRVMEFFADGIAVSEPRALRNVTNRERLKTSSVAGWNLEVDHQLLDKVFLRVKAEERRARNLLLIAPNVSAPNTTALVLSDNGRSLYRELESTLSFQPHRSSNLNLSYIRSTASGDLNSFSSVQGTFEKPSIGSNRHARSRSDSPHRFLAWGNMQTLWGVEVSPSLDAHTGFPFAFVDASNSIAPEADFGRFPRWFSVDFGLHRDFQVEQFGRNGRVRLGVRVHNLTNHFNPRGADVTEDEFEERPLLRGFFDGPGRTYRASLVFNF